MDKQQTWLTSVAEILEELVADRADHEAMQGIATVMCECLQRALDLLATEDIIPPACHIYEFENYARSGIELEWYVAPKTLTLRFSKGRLLLMEKSKQSPVQNACVRQPGDHQIVAAAIKWLLSPEDSNSPTPASQQAAP